MRSASESARGIDAVGALVQDDGSMLFRVWAPRPSHVSLVITGADGQPRDVDLANEGNGFYAMVVPTARPGDRYQYRLDGELAPDPASRFQPDGPFGPSEIVESDHHWTDDRWPGVKLVGQVFYELHIGTFTREGTWRAAMAQLPGLVETGITCLEVMPVAEFAGQFGWGYDGVFPYAPSHLYGRPDDFRAFVDRAHALGLGVILDVVYNHLGPEGCVFHRYSEGYFSQRYKGEWGDPLNFDENAEPVRAFFTQNATYWIREFHLDGLRLDATQGIFDSSSEHLLARIARDARAAAGTRSIVLVAENEPQLTRLVRPPEAGGYGLDALWNDDFHHSAIVAITGRREAYYSDHAGTPQEFISAAKYGYLFQGQRYAWQEKARGTSTRGLPPAAFVNFIENHDQVANSGDGSRLHARTSPGRFRAMTALLLLLPGTPLLFQGQEFGSTVPFRFFADLNPDLAAQVEAGRAEFVSQFPSLATGAMQAQLPAPHDPATFECCRLDWSQRERNLESWRLHRDLLALRRGDEAFRHQRTGAVDGAVLGPEIFLLRYATNRPDAERLLVVNFGQDFVCAGMAEPLMAPPDGCEWRTAWSSEAIEYGGLSTPHVVTDAGWRVLGHSAVVLAAHLTASEGTT